MICIEVETPWQSESRLRSALRSARVEMLPQAYLWQPCTTAPSGAFGCDEGIAMARSERGWCRLAPANQSAEGETWALVSLQFETGAQNMLEPPARPRPRA